MWKIDSSVKVQVGKPVKKAFAVMQARDGGLAWSGGSSNEKWSESEYILKVYVFDRIF